MSGSARPNAYAVHSVVGITQGTKQSGRLDGDRLVMLQSFDGEDMRGDGTVPRVSATPIETDDDQPPYQPMYSSEAHGSLQVAEAVQTQLLGILTARPPVGFRGGRGIAVEADELLAAGEPLAVRGAARHRRAHAAGIAGRPRHRPTGGRRRARPRRRRGAHR